MGEKILENLKFVWHKNQESLYSKEEAYDPLKHMIISQDVVDGKGFKQFAQLPFDVDWIQQLINESSPNEKCYYIVIPNADQIQKLKFDIDIDKNKTTDCSAEEWEMLNEDKDQVKYMIIACVQQTLKKLYNFEEMPQVDFSIDQSHREEKISFHIVLQNFFVKSANETKEFIVKMRENPNFKLYTKFIDLSVHKNFQSWRLRGCCKKGKTNFKLKEKGTFTQQLPIPTPQELMNIENPQKYIGCKTKLLQTILVERHARIEETVDIGLINPTDVEKLLLLICESVSQSKNSLCDAEFPTKINYVNWFMLLTIIVKVIPNEVERLRLVLFIYDRMYRRANAEERQSFCEDRIASCKKQYGHTMGTLHHYAMENPRYKEEFKQEYSEVAINKLLKIRENSHLKIEDIDESIKYVKDIVFPEGVKVVGISAGLGRGKTSAIIRHINQHQPKRILVLSPRQSYALSIADEYNKNIEGEKFECYLSQGKKRLTMTKNINKFNRVIISMESIHKLFNTCKEDMPKFDLVILDEVEANLTQHCQKDTAKENINLNIVMFESIIRSSDKIILGDAFITIKTVNYFKNLNIPLHMLNYGCKLESRKATRINKNPNHIIPKLDESLAKGKRSYCIVSSKNKAEQIRDEMVLRFPTKKILLYTTETPKVIDVRQEWVDADCIISTTTITVGINFDIPDIFHNIFI